MWRVLEPRVESVRRDLATEFGCDPEEIAITRNASEAMETLIFGIDLHRGDEVIITDQNYPRMITSWEQRSRREGIVVKKISFPIPLPSPGAFVERVRAAITPKTRAIEFPQITNLSGQILPVRDVVRLGRERGIAVFVDGAHAFAHLPFRRDDLECDYFGCSLHKWLLAPIGTGFLYVRKSRLKSIWPLMGADPPLDEDIRKYEQIGTHPAANHNAIAPALAFHRSIGTERKIARLRHLRDRWARSLLAADRRVRLWTPIEDDAASGGIALLQIEGVDSGKLFGYLWDKHRIITSPTKHAQFEGIRLTPNVYTTLDEVDLFVDAMKQALTKGI
jgi:selenocysteine lyase/cysteine desulfurase